ncbi:MAG: UDP-glucose 4-epimerase GalE [Bifidobacteriaceae bacterium]|nr:UDP-glucose 4-epimerase GalE [Bifidobacteriaceae bacterium]
MKIVVTGGAGYIGGHVVRSLLGRGDDVVVVDDLSEGAAARIGAAELVRLDVADPAALGGLAAAMAGADAVVHLAARKQVGESVRRPAWYFQQNVGGVAGVLAAMERAGVGRLVFSSSAAVYGVPADAGAGGRIVETAPTRPVNPYGETKLAGEWAIRDAAAAWGLRAVSLRYFNVAGAGWPDLGDSAALNLIPLVFEALDAGGVPVIFGEDYPTPDGTCVRDYVHVRDVAAAHLAALDRLAAPGPAGAAAVNIGTGVGASVREVIAAVAQAAGRAVAPTAGPRRPGDPPSLVCDPGLALRELGWRASAGLPEIVASAWAAWRSAHDAGAPAGGAVA